MTGLDASQGGGWRGRQGGQRRREKDEALTAGGDADRHPYQVNCVYLLSVLVYLCGEFRIRGPPSSQGPHKEREAHQANSDSNVPRKVVPEG